MAEPERDYQEGVEALQADMASHQRRFAGEVTARANHELAVATIERLEKENADRPSVASTVPAPPSIVHEATSHQVEDRKYVLDKAPDKPMFRTASEFEHQVLAHAMPRIELLLTKHDTGAFGQPSWSTRTQAAMYFKVKSLEAAQAKRDDLAEHYERAYQLDLEELLEQSNASFGEWRKDAPSRLIVSG